ncbi:ATP-dependent metallopeptidase FtsH/Yme1/Tma family protein [bacterium]|jgi:cell division protease FtsH|nr:ATP-dependent metallopeptidase FtsH/Yme1/Tma family protein [bacterium]MBT4121532.1 ATP-dependent metallopeptidase FtsH/Yme1/Tma family protein [bacterium]MBT4495225.1 ATP-dependent metallopeptidase FtsH/Yme1/Tma family protein [bacterium]MBT4763559.1 ATP-dependent metallopeptidase FtsH/Yme1/Tma family protein [bacterium]MBT5400930.1 ATP-dependent metallopeptidase FtsH/Yme1/Tma family protein [bacterium]
MKKSKKKQNQLFKNFAIFLLVFIFIASVFSMYDSAVNEKPQEIGINQLVEHINNEEVKNIEIENSKLLTTLNDDSIFVIFKEPNQSLTELLSNFSVEANKMSRIEMKVKQDSTSTVWLTSLLPFLIPFLFIGLFIWFMMRQAQGANNRAMSFGQSSAKMINQDTKNKTTFKDVAGSHEAKEELSEIVDFLKNPRKFLSMGAKIPKGVLLLGSPGTGKTLMARAVAGEAKVPYFHISGSEFVEMFVGVGASRVRDLFKKAKKAAPAIVFVDEIDAVGRQRGSGLGGSHDEREQTLNQILTEMDGFETDTNVIVIAATNRPDVLDPALLRPGRFDRQVVIDLPDIKERNAILEVHAKNKPFDSDAKLKTIAQRTPGFSGADLANLLNEAAILAAKQNRKKITMDDLINSIEKVMLGPERKSHVLSEKEKKITAYHEAGHALVAHMLPDADPVHKVSIISRGRAAGYTMKLPLEDKNLHNRREFIDELAVLLAGHVTEKEVFGDVTTGASSDLRKATQLAKQLITQYGMSEKLGPRTFGEGEGMVFLGKELHERRDYSEKTAEAIDNEVSNFIHEASKTAKEIITKHKNYLDKISDELLVKETLEKEEFEALFKTQ